MRSDEKESNQIMQNVLRMNKSLIDQKSGTEISI